MKRLGFGCLSVWAAFSASAGTPPPALDPALGKVVARCKASPDQPPKIWFFKQWHLAPSVDTHAAAPANPLPQAANQTAIYRQLERWIAEKQIAEIYAEGCAGEIGKDSSLRFNGWDLSTLHEAAGKPGYAEIVASVPLKLEAKFGDGVRTVCGDDEALIKESNLAFSDARGTAGFLSRIVEYRSDSRRLKTYLEGAIQLYKLPADTSVDAVIARLKKELRASLARVNELIARRNAKLVVRLSAAKSTAAVVFGGIHARGTVELLDRAGVACAVVEPAGYQNGDVELLDRLDQLLK
jgi:hypothetical protein